MQERRVDRIAKILKETSDGRAKVGDVLTELRRIEENASLTHSAVYIAMQSENDRLMGSGELPLFRTAKQGGDWGWVSLESESDLVSGSPADNIKQQILDANKDVDKRIRERLESMDWRTFESDFLIEVLEKLGFQDVEITQATRDGGADARVTYKRGLVEASAIVSAKRWGSRSPVPVAEVRLMRGIKGDEDTAIIVTSSSFTKEAQVESRPSQNQRVVYLIDGDRLVDICKRHRIGVRGVEMPDILTLVDESLSSHDEEDCAAPSVAKNVQSMHRLSQFRDKMLDELSISEIATLLGLKESSVRSYLSIPGKKSRLGARIRTEEDVRARAIALIQEKRHTVRR